jgi:hypothetical protein
VSVEPTLAYGESIANAPLLIDGGACAAESIDIQDDTISIAFPARESVCLDRLERAGAVTLPLLYGKGKLLAVRLGGGAATIAAARRACRGGQVAAIAPQTVAPPARTLPIQPDTGAAATAAGALDTRARAFIEDYMRRSAGDVSEALGYARRLFVGEVGYYGKHLDAEQVLADKRRYFQRWPQRQYRLKPETLRVACDETRATCRIAGELEFRAADPATARVSSGTASYDLRVVFTAAGPRIIEENGRMLSRNR